MPLPPYIKKPLQDQDRYQPVYARERGSAAAPTAGLHFTPELMAALSEQGVLFTKIMLHVGLGTFRPVKSDTVEGHTMHSEFYRVSAEAAEAINAARAAGGRIIAVGTTAVRTLETVADEEGNMKAEEGWTCLLYTSGLINADKGAYQLEEFGALRTPAGRPAHERLCMLYDALNSLLDRSQPDQVAIEQLFFNKNTTTAVPVGQARGVLLLACAQRQLPISEYTPLEVKQALTGYGRAEKQQIQYMVCHLLKMDAPPKNCLLYTSRCV